MSFQHPPVPGDKRALTQDGQEPRTWTIYRVANSRLRGALALQPYVEGIDGPETGGWVRVVEEARLAAAEQERDRLREIAIACGACHCTWGVVDANGVDHGHDVICKPAEDCPVHSCAAPREGQDDG